MNSEYYMYVYEAASLEDVDQETCVLFDTAAPPEGWSTNPKSKCFKIQIIEEMN